MSGSIHGKLSRVRPPRVHITYEVETGGAEVKKELPFVVGVVGDLAGNNPSKELKPLRERKFVQIDRDTFDKVMASMAPRTQSACRKHARWRRQRNGGAAAVQQDVRL